MQITGLSSQQRDPDRVNVMIDGQYRLSLDISQIGELGVKVGREVDQATLEDLLTESQFGKLYSRALEYCLIRPHSSREVRDYLWRKTRDTKFRSKKTGEIMTKVGYSPALAERVLQKLQHKNYVNDEVFARWWVENRNLVKGTSLRKLRLELQTKGVASEIIGQVLSESDRQDDDELAKVIAKKGAKYSDQTKLMQYLARQGFSYDDIKAALEKDD